MVTEMFLPKDSVHLTKALQSHFTVRKPEAHPGDAIK